MPTKKYELIKIYPGSPTLGTIEEPLGSIHQMTNGYFGYDIANSPEYWKELSHLFITDDGKEINVGDFYFWVNKYTFKISHGEASKGSMALSNNLANFANRDNANKYIEMNKPIFSKNDLLKMSKKIYSPLLRDIFLELISKLDNLKLEI